MAAESLQQQEVATAQTILDAAGVTTPTGNLAKGCFDELGNLYVLPDYLLSDPVNLTRVSNVASVVGDGEDTSAASKEVDVFRSSARISATDHGEKGKGVNEPIDSIKVRTRLSDRGGRDVVVTIGKDESVKMFIARLKEEGGVSRLSFL
jgi:hypothetical protein